MTGGLSAGQPETTALRWGGWAGVLGSLSLLAVFGFLAALVGLDTPGIEDEIRRYPEIRLIRALENALYLVATALWTVHAAALYRALRFAHAGAALTGAVLLALGTAILATGAVPHIATDPIAALYHADTTEPATRAMALVGWTAVQGIVDALVVTGLTLAPLGMACLSLAMWRHPCYGPVFATLSLVLALAGAVSAVLCLIAPSDIAALGIFALVFFNILIGWRTARLAKRPGAAS